MLAAIICFTAAVDAHAAKRRKKVGVVLSGGGAKGVAHIGALKVIEEAGIPIDYIVGTSMGSIVGGLYSIGYTPAQLDSMVRHQDWTFLLSDQTPRSQQSMGERETRETYVLSLPLTKERVRNITGGFIKGQNIANLFSKLTIGYHDSIDFNHLPIPFACVSQNIVNGTEVRFHSGVLSTAMRASMAIPGVFTPVRIDSMVLVDGGVINNYPVDVAREMGADIVIGVDVQSELKSAEKLNGTGDILGQLINLMGQDQYLKNLKNTDTYIKVDVDGYSTASFSATAIDTLIRRGEEAATEQRQELLELKKRIGIADSYRPKSIAPYPFTPDRKVYVREIVFNGLDEKDMKWLLKRYNLKKNSNITIEEIENATALLCSNLEYSTATYTLPKHPDGGYTLVLNLSKKYEKRINLGLRYDSEETASVMAQVTHAFHTKIPTTLDVTARFGKRYAAQIDFGLEPSPLHRLGASYLFEYNDIDFTDHGKHTHSVNFRYHRGELSYSNVWHRNIRYALGLRYEAYNFHKALFGEGTATQFSMNDEQIIAYFAQLKYESFDHAYFPSRGISFQASYELCTDNFTKYSGHRPFSVISGHFGAVIPITNRFSILPDIYGRFLIGNDIPYFKLNYVGGDIAGRYFHHQLPFVGVNNAEVMDKSLLLGSLKLRQRMGGIHYITLTANYALNASEWKYLLKEKTLFGCGIGYGVNSIFGPLEASINYLNRSKEFNYYINLGYKF